MIYGGKMKSLTDSVQVLPGVGPKRVQALAELGISTIEDLITYYPFRYEDLATKEPQNVVDQQKVNISRGGCNPAYSSSFWASKSPS